MSKKRQAKVSWDSDEELLNDTIGNVVTALHKTSEPSLSGDNKMLDEDALLSVDEAGVKSKPLSNKSANSLATSKGNKDTVAHEATLEGNDYVASDQAFVFEETENTYLDDVLNLGGSTANEMAASNNGAWAEMRPDVAGLSTQENASEAKEEMSITELEQEQPMEQEEKVSADQGHLDSKEKSENGGSDSDAEGSHHNSGKFKSERSGVISLTPTTVRDKIPDTLEINKEQAAQLKQYLPDKSHRGRGKMRGQGRPSAHSRLGIRPGGGLQQNPQVLLGQFLRGVLGQQPRMGFPFQGGSPNRGPFPAGILNPQGQYPVRPLNRTFSGPPQNQRIPFNIGSTSPRGLLPTGSFNVPQSAPQRGSSLPLQHGRFPGAPNQRGLFPGGPQQTGPNRMPTGPQPIRGLPPNQLRFQGFPNQRVVNPGQFGQKPPLLGQQGIRAPSSGLGLIGPRPLIGNSGPRPLIGNVGPRPLTGNAGPRPLTGNAGPRPFIGNAGPRPLIGNAGPGMRFARPNHPPPTTQQGQSIPLLVNQVANALKSSLGFQQLRPGQANSFMMPNSSNRPQGPMQNFNRFQHPLGQPQGPLRFMPRTPVSGGPFMNQNMIRGNRQPLLGGQGGFPMPGKPKIFINPRFQSMQPGFGFAGVRPFRMNIPVQQRKAKALLDRAKQTQNKHAVTVPMKLTGIKRKSTGGDDVPSKIVKPDETATVVMTGNVC